MNKPLDTLTFNAKILLAFGICLVLGGFLLAQGFSAAFTLGFGLLSIGAFLLLLGAIASFLATHAAALIEADAIRDERES